ncbi:AMP-binding protein [Amnibacterium sp. CER49]|uniref:AMP-binding protein n=1 Tax=Amnibacterium sp. CER49 TaxID=3039161 RepID=UPI00244AEBC4|nr:AMP-binding protein [Amnibacterium sp. CER49]MDH2444246.1 AMP-binding protein [Amnibacterium sp. CER49]
MTLDYAAARDLLLRTRTDYAAARTAFAWPELPDRFDWAVDWFDRLAEGPAGQRLALRILEADGTEERRTFAELSASSERVAAWLAAQGVRQGDHVLVMLGNRVELWESMLALMKLGAVTCPTSTMLGPADLEDRITRGGMRHVIAEIADTGKFDGLDAALTRIVVGGDREGWRSYTDAEVATGARPRVSVHPDDPCLMYFTSGTTNRPKMVVHTHRSYPVGHLTTLYWIGIQPGDVHLAISSAGWAKHAWSCFFAPWIAEATVLVVNSPRFEAAALLAALDAAAVSTFCAPPTVWRLLLQADLGRRPRALREVVSAGEPLNPEVIARVEEAWGLTVRDGYGQTEMTAVIANPPGRPLVPGAMGVPMPGVAVTLVDPITGEEADEGEVCIDRRGRADNLMADYRSGPGDLDPMPDRDLFHTGDVAVRDADGSLTFVGRTDDIFKSSDYKVSPFEVESMLLTHPAVAEAAVVPAPDPTRLFAVKAYVALAGGFPPDADTARAILAHAREHAPAYQRVRRVEFFELPKTISGKIRRVELREREQAAASRLPDEFRDDDFPELRGAGRG